MQNNSFKTKHPFSTFRSFWYNIYRQQTSLLEANNRSSWATPSLCLWECRRYQRWIVTAAELTWLTNLKQEKNSCKLTIAFQLPCQAKQFLMLRKAQKNILEKQILTTRLLYSHKHSYLQFLEIQKQCSKIHCSRKVWKYTNNCK